MNQPRLPNPWWGIGISAAVFIVYYVIAFITKRATHDSEDLYVAGRGIGVQVNALATTATWISVASFMGIVALIQQLHLPFIYFWMQAMLSIPMIVLFFGGLRRLGSFTSVSFVWDRFGPGVTYLLAFLTIVVLLMFMVAQNIGVAKLFEVMLGWPYIPSLLLSAVITIVYVALGGMKGATYTQAIQMVIMAIAFIVPLGVILHGLGAPLGAWVPVVGYGNLTDRLLKAVPQFYDLKFPPRFYVAMILTLTLGQMGLPHLAQRIYTSLNIQQARRVVPWYCIWSGITYMAVFAMGVAGAIHFGETGQRLSQDTADKVSLLLSLRFAPQWLTGFLMAGILAAGVSTISGLMVGVATIVGNDIVSRLRPSWTEDRALRFGYIAIAATGVVSLLIALKPPPFLVASIFWGLGLCASSVTPLLIMGAWSTRINKWGALVGSLIPALIYVFVSPYVGPFTTGIVLGQGPTASFGLAAAIVCVPLSVILTVVVSLATERVSGLNGEIDQERTQELVERMHGWPEISGTRYRGVGWLVGLAAAAVPMLWWGLQPWR